MDRSNILKESLGRFLRAVFDVMVLNILWAVCSLPIVTIGPATCALFYVMLRVVRDEPVTPVRDFFKGFRSDFRLSFLSGLILPAGAAVVYADITFALSLEGSFRIVYLILSGLITGVLLIFLCYYFPLVARYSNTFTNHVRNAFSLAFCSPGKTLLMMALYSAPAAVFVFLPFEVVIRIGFLYILFGLAGPAYFASGILRNLFDRLFPEENSCESEDIENDKA